CSTDAVVASDLLTVRSLSDGQGAGDGALIVQSSLTATADNPLRIRANGKYLVFDDAGELRYLEITAPGAGIGLVIDSGAYSVDCADGGGRVGGGPPPVAVRARPAELPLFEPYSTFVFAYATAAGPATFLGDPLADDDATTIQVRVVNAGDGPIRA